MDGDRETLLYGTLDILITKASGLKNTDHSLFKRKNKSDPYVFVALDSFKVARTTTKDDCLDPLYNEAFEVKVNGRFHAITFSVWDDDFARRDTLLGFAKIPLTAFINTGHFSGTITLGPLPGKNRKGSYGSLEVSLKYIAAKDLLYSYEVPGTSFPSRKGCRVTLFQDAHVGSSKENIPSVDVIPNEPNTEVIDDKEDSFLTRGKRLREYFRSHPDEEGSSRAFMTRWFGTRNNPPRGEWAYRRQNCWEKIYRTILHAKYFIYITGWSVDTSISLLREKPIFANGEGPDDDDNGMLTIGELLKRKSAEGVRVCLLLWDEATSVAGTASEGLMCTHDEVTKEYFEGTEVTVQLALRNGRDASSKFSWTHHQKSIILDALTLYPTEGEEDGADEKRRIVSFVGGLDLCDGRWDTADHSLYSTLDTHHANDFHTVWPGITQDHGPREPWHDIHCRLEGPISRDILTNFEQRWKKQASSQVSKLVNLAFLPVVSDKEEQVYEENHWNNWSVQLFRSIDEFSAEMGTERIDKSIQMAYIHHIRRAKRFIYMENQYFIGSAHAWENGVGKNVQCSNLVPLELTMRIVSAIEEGKRFCVYIMLPMYPEGIPTDGAVQEILAWQRKTIQMMYSRIWRALARNGKVGEETPMDYLTFYCMGQREKSERQGVSVPSDIQERLNQTNRFAIYVHSKMMIVDDDYIIVGSANINERSLAGDRDTEIAIGAYQPHFTNSEKRRPKGMVHAFRLGLWYSHMRRSLDCFLEPESLACKRKVHDIAKHNWELFAGDDFVDMKEHGHLLKYPFTVSDNGIVTSLPGHENIPDTIAPVLGSTSKFIPDMLTV